MQWYCRNPMAIDDDYVIQIDIRKGIEPWFHFRTETIISDGVVPRHIIRRYVEQYIRDMTNQALDKLFGPDERSV